MHPGPRLAQRDRHRRQGAPDRPLALLPEGWLHTAVGGVIYRAVQRATSRLLNKRVWPVPAVFAVLTVGASLLHSLVFPERAVLAVVLVGLLPAIPCFYGVWRVLSR